MSFRRRWICRSAALALLVCAAQPARAQSCCVGASALFPVRLVGPQFAAAAVSVDVRGDYGSFSAKGAWVPSPAGTREVGFRQSLLGAVAPLRRLQFNLALPFVETWRQQAGQQGAGGGIGDLQLGGRFDAFFQGKFPGLAVLAALTLPTGRPVDAASGALGADATGQGTVQGTGGLALEYFAGEHLVLELTGSVSGRLARSVGEVRSQLGPGFQAALAAAWVFQALQVVALTVSFSRELDARINDAWVPGTGRGAGSVGLFGALPLPQGFSLQGTLAAELPIPRLGLGQPAGVTLSVVVVKRWPG